MGFLIALAAMVGSVVFQVVLTGLWPAAATFFDLPLIPVIYFAITRGPTWALLMGLGAGLLEDSLEGTLLGVNALSKSLVGYLVGRLSLRFALVPLMSRVVVLAMSTALSGAIAAGTLAIMGRSLAYSPYPDLLETILGNSAAGFLVMGAGKREGPQ